MSEMDKARELSDAIQRSTERLNDAYAILEERLIALHFGVRAAASVGTPGAADYLGTVAFQKQHDGAWGIVFTAKDVHNLVPIHSASREVRVRASRSMEDLVRALYGAVECQTTAIDDAAKDVKRAKDLVELLWSGKP